MNIINEVRIENYKGLENIEFSSAPINVIVGPNNTGKSSILESIWMGVSSQNKFRDSLDTEISDFIEYNYIKHLIYQGKHKSRIELKILKNKKITLDLLYSEKDYPKEVADYFLNFIDNFSKINFKYRPTSFINNEEFYYLRNLRHILIKLDRLRLKDQKEKVNELIEKITKEFDYISEKFRNDIIKSEKLFLISKVNNRLISIYTIMEAYEGEIAVERNMTSDAIKIPIAFSSNRFEEDILELYRQLIRNKSLFHEVKEILINRMPYFEDIREMEEELYVWLSNTPNTLPLSFMGDGFIALLKLSFITPLIKNGVILFEEPEIEMHPGYLDILAEEIVLNAENSQFFITTHSLELLDYILEKATEKNILDSVNVIRLHREVDGHIRPEIMNGRKAQEEREVIKSDLRGY